MRKLQADIGLLQVTSRGIFVTLVSQCCGYLVRNLWMVKYPIPTLFLRFSSGFVADNIQTNGKQHKDHISGFFGNILAEIPAQGYSRPFVCLFICLLAD